MARLFASTILSALEARSTGRAPHHPPAATCFIEERELIPWRIAGDRGNRRGARPDAPPYSHPGPRGTQQKCSLLARIIKHLISEMQVFFIKGDSTEQNETLTVSWSSLERRKADFEDLVNRQIPKP